MHIRYFNAVLITFLPITDNLQFTPSPIKKEVPFLLPISLFCSFDFFLCLSVWGLSIHSRTFYSYGDATITGEGLKMLTYAWHSYGHWAVRVLSHATPTVTLSVRLLWSSPGTHNTHTYCRTLSSGAVTTCFYDLGLSRDPNHSACEADALIHCATAAVFFHLKIKKFIKCIYYMLII